MAFDRVGLFLYPPRWERQRVLDPRLTRSAGMPVCWASHVRTPDNTAPVVRFAGLCRWLASRGFEIVVEGQDYVTCSSRSIRSGRGPRPEIEVSASGEAGEVTNLLCWFLLTRRAPARLERWEAFMHQLCGTFGFRIVVADGESLGPDEFVAFVRGSYNWQRFAERFG
jgi:hypothetical protein